MINLYEILGVKKDATTEEIKKAYRTLSKIHHPDKGGDADRFANINLAYKTLKSKSARETYDQTGEVKAVFELRSRALGVLASHLQQCLGMDYVHTDIVDAITKAIEKGLANLHGNIAEAQDKIDRLNDIKVRFVKDGNAVVGILQGMENDLRHIISANEREKLVANEALAILADCEYNFDEIQHISFFGGTGSGTTTATGF